MPAGFWLLGVMFCYKWVDTILCCSGSNGATHRDALPSHCQPFPSHAVMGRARLGEDQTQFLPLKQMFLEVNFFPQAFPVIPVMLLVFFPLQALGSCIAVLSYRIFQHARLVGRHCWVLDWVCRVGESGCLVKGQSQLPVC